MHNTIISVFVYITNLYFHSAAHGYYTLIVCATLLCIEPFLTMNPGLKNVSICAQHENCQIRLKIVSTKSQNSS